MTKPLIILFFVFCLLAAVSSNRPFYHVIVSYLNPIGGGGWHRAKLIDCAIESFSEWRMMGYGGKDPGWGQSMGMKSTDVTNHFLLAGVRFGGLGIVALIFMLTTIFYYLVKAYRRSVNLELRSLHWHLGCVIASIAIVWMSVSFWGQCMSLFYFVLGSSCSSCNFVSATIGLPRSLQIVRKLQ